MRYWMPFISCVALLLQPAIALATPETPEYCGGSYVYTDMYYPILDQHIIADQSLWPFLNCPFNDLCGDQGWDGTVGNISEWQMYLGKDFSKAEVKQLIYGKNHSWYEELLKSKTANDDLLLAKKIKSKRFKPFIKYMILAKKSEGIRSNATSYGRGWYQGENETKKDLKPELLAMALKLNSDEKDVFLKNRYGFQIVRLTHYLGENSEAIRYFDKLMQLTPKTHYSYYLALEQKSGAAYNLREIKEAAEGFLRVYEELPSRRKSCALSLRFLDWSSNELQSGVAETYPASHFFKAYHAQGDISQEMLDLEQESPNSAYLEVLTIREIDKLQEHLFAHTSDYWGEFQKRDKPKSINTISQIANRMVANEKVKNTDFWRLIQTVILIDKGDVHKAKKMVSAISSESPVYKHAKRLDFAIAVKGLQDIDRPTIEILFQTLKNDSTLFEYTPISGYFFNHVASLYRKEENILMADFGYFSYDNQTQESLTWEQVSSSLGGNLNLHWKYNYVDKAILEKFQKTVFLKDKTEYEQLILSKLQSSPEDYFNELKGTWYLWQNDLDNAIATLEKIEHPELFYADDIRTMLFSASPINEYFDVTFAAQSDGVSGEYSQDLIRNSSGDDLLFDQYYKDNKLLLAKNLKKLELLAKERPRKAAAYYMILGNAWYNTGKTGWFLNTLHYVSNDSRNHVLDEGYSYSDEQKSYTADNFTENATYYFKKVLESEGSSEAKAKATFMLAKTNYSFTFVGRKVKVMDEHLKYFEQLKETYGNTDFVKYDVIPECSWYRSFLE